jgi:hypothetical protein
MEYHFGYSGIIFTVEDEIDIGYIEYQVLVVGILPEEIKVALLDPCQVFSGNVLLIISASHSNVFQESIRRHVQVDIEVRLWQ